MREEDMREEDMQEENMREEDMREEDMREEDMREEVQAHLAMSGLPAASRLSTTESRYLLHHVFLPPKLPQEDDYNAVHETVMLDSVIDALARFQDYWQGQESEVVVSVKVMLTRLRAMRDCDGDVNHVELRKALGELENSGMASCYLADVWNFTDTCCIGGALPVHVRCQNAAVLMTRHSDSIHVETFELWPRNNAVNTTVGRLQRQFPGPTFALDRAIFNEPNMQNTIAHALESMSRQPAPGTKPKVKKARHKHDEDRDTTNPMMVTELFTTFLRPQCRTVDSLQVRKNTREEVLWLDTLHPWRRSALWLQVRVTIQVFIRRLSQREGISVDLYKVFMVFYMSSILHRCPESISSEHRYIMSSKIVRRLRKLDLPPDNHDWLLFVQCALREANGVLEQNWSRIIARNACRPDMSALTRLNFKDDTDCSLPNLDEWLQSITTCQHSLVSPDSHPQSGLLEFEPAELPSLLQLTDPDYHVYNLAAFEAWVDLNLQSWIETHIGYEDTCERLSSVVNAYFNIASELYASNPEALSTMLLTVLELWIACDKSAVHIHPLLRQYHTCIPIHLFQSLLLSRLSQLTRLAQAELYMCQRHQDLQYPDSNVLTDFGTSSSFSVRYFDNSAEHQRLLDTIEQRAGSEKAAKVVELHRKHQQYRDYCARRDEISCTFYDEIVDRRFLFTERRHSPSCKRCGFDKAARGITIDVHEWPLSSNPLEAKSTVFELKLPRPFAFWRDITAFILLDVLGIKYVSEETPRAEYRPNTYSGLSMFYTAVVDHPRIGLLSQVKPHRATHRREKYIINVSESDVCLANGLRFKYFDNALRCFTEVLSQTHATATACTYKLPPSSSSLQPFLFRPAETPDGQSPNTVIASQHACPENMSLGEYKALCSMPLGVHIQWQNILRQLAAPSVVFNKVETCLFTLQIMHQAGPPSPMHPTLREGHHVLNDDLFAAPLLREIKKTAAAIAQNWQSAEELSVLIALTQKSEECIAQLDGLRKISFQWVMTVGEKAGATDSDEHRNNLMASAAYLALMCVGTFDCENSHLEQMLRNDLAASVFIQCSMIIHDRRSLLDGVSSGLLPIFYYRWQSIAFRGHRIFANHTVHGRTTALDRAIQRTWAAYRPGSPWTAAPGGSQCCLNTQMMVERGSNSGVVVHVNLLTGQLLINGRPLARLPSEFERHNTYRSLFGHSLVEVMPSNLPGLEFSAQRLHMGQTIYLGKLTIPKQSGFDLRIRAVDGSRVWEFVSPRLLADALPDAFVEGYAHWYETDGQFIEFRPLNDPWKSSPVSHWRLQRTQLGNNWRLTQGSISLINMRSETARSLSDIFQPLEKAPKLHYKLHRGSDMVEIEIPRLGLGFDLRSGQSSIESRQYRGMVVDPDQSVGTLIGLRNKLVLLDRNTHNRRILIPEGQITWEQGDGHVAVKVGWQAATRVHVYLVNSDIGCLTDNGTLQSKLVLCYLHAVTSFCTPDPLTKHTGTEQSLSILRSASMRSFNQLQPENISILKKLASLTPARRYYPANERVMQSVRWDPILGCLAQHDEFHSQVAAILDQHRRMRIFNPASQGTEPSLPSWNADLLQRDRIRSSTFRISGFGAEDHTDAKDCPYEELGRDYQSESCSRVFSLCRILYEDIPSAQNVMLEILAARLWEFLTTSNTVHGASSSIDSTQIKYDAMWLTETGEFVSSHWCSIHRLLCSETARPNRYAVMLWLSTLAFSRKIDIIVLHVLAAMYILPGMASMTLPAQRSYRPQKGSKVNCAELKTRIHSVSRSVTPEDGLSPGPAESYSMFHARVAKLRKTKRKQALAHFIEGLEGQWPTRCPSTPISGEQPAFADYFDTQKAMQISQAAFPTWFDNRELRQYLDRVASVYTAQKVQPIAIPPCLYPCAKRPADRRHAFISVDDIVDESLGPAPAVEMEPPTLPPWSGSRTAPDPNLRLLSLVDALESQARSQFQKQYIERLRASVTSLQGIQDMDHPLPDDDILETVISHHLHRCQEYHEEISRSIMSRMMLSDTRTGEVRPGSDTQRNILGTFANVNVWPRVSSQLLLHQLTRKRWSHLPGPWKKCLIAYGCSITALQRAKRLVNLMGHRVDLARELQNAGHTNWNPMDFPESLLLEIESGLLIRDVQEQIARRMRHAQPGHNVVMQLNMGEGKSSVIVPIVAAALADRSLVRIIVAKPQSRQMFQMLVSKLGGLLGRRVYHLPVSRSLRIGESEAREIEWMCKDCMAEGGVLLVQPEHLLSLKLMCLECFITGREAVGVCLLRILDFFQTSSRDLVDESDENFSVKFELIYTMGTQRPLELSPQRWNLIQEMLGLVRRYAPVIKMQLPRSIEVEELHPGSFPRIRLLRADAAHRLFERIADHISHYGIDNLPISRQPEAERRAAIAYCLEPDPSEQKIAVVEKPDASGLWADSTKDPLLLLRGLLAGNVLAFCLGQRRWRVNCGLDRSRQPPTRLAVPFRAKDNPAPRAEFSHPDVVIVLTCLSYYYEGLCDDDLFQAFDHLVGSDQADAEYQIWVDDAPNLPSTYCQLMGVNLQDRLLCVECIFPCLRFAKGVIDYFLAHIIFAKGLREFPSKLSSSGWDIGEVKCHPTVGFSGTNDSRVTLPLSVEQLDLPDQNHTNALVLEYLLRSETGIALIPPRDDLTKSDAQVLLDMVAELDPAVRVILDVGARILELSNLEVAKTWLEMIGDDSRTQAVVFINDDDEITVVNRTGLVEPLRTSPFERHLDQCLVFLDEAHTRGIDLMLPLKTRAAVTLGPSITKDKLVQACMRMRKLGKGQSVVFCIPEEIKFQILALCGRSHGSDLTVADVLRWAISETWDDMQRSMPLWAVQGKRYQAQARHWRALRQDGQTSISKCQAEGFLEPESQSLEQRYRPGRKNDLALFPQNTDDGDLCRILDRCREFATVKFSAAQLQEEQERELAPEIEQERQVQRPPPAEPEPHSVHPDIRLFVATGHLDASSTAVSPAFMVLEDTSAAKYLDVAQFPSELLVTKDFARTVRLPDKLSARDSYQRAVEWVLMSNDHPSKDGTPVRHMVIISPYEANSLHSDIRGSGTVTMHLYAPRQNQSSYHLDKLDLYPIPTGSSTRPLPVPESLRIQLNLFAGQLYISSYNEYCEICRFLGVASTAAPEGLAVAADGFIVENQQAGAKFTKSPLRFLKVFMSQIRKDGQEIDKTHLGKILDGKLLLMADFQDCNGRARTESSKYPM
ncbi:hypothetical protein ASPACDRAFT_51200 [Aspergillus aculeatus ATCC 16872]|uniref:ubiquitinyl hydrolase 1 n=1 Tax=Aspergillus aculeatus (strain ATCC 16872 / CBS 172.66 / WB 5094) TaxID=690307 RepID=A0A1L9WYS0_ASPA1|nr:uncharacterized protein ASPACDRAFT_51200 [Aspergillus aculeatus ATCC 16872]OJK01293.1 hypothetical protein ASPACDRAFT_51200 [Aspergillus aculeatus ATCC 16872]